MEIVFSKVEACIFLKNGHNHRCSLKYFYKLTTEQNCRFSRNAITQRYNNYSKINEMTTDRAVKWKFSHNLRWLLYKCKIKNFLYSGMIAQNKTIFKHEGEIKNDILPRRKKFLYTKKEKNLNENSCL